MPHVIGVTAIVVLSKVVLSSVVVSSLTEVKHDSLLCRLDTWKESVCPKNITEQMNKKITFFVSSSKAST